MGEKNGVTDKYFIVKRRLDRCISAVENALEGKKYDTLCLRYSKHLVNAAIECILNPVRGQLKISQQHRELSVLEMFREGKHQLTPVNCYVLLNGKTEPQKIVNAFGVLESLIVGSQSVEREKISQTVELLKSARTMLDDPKNLY